VGSSPFLLEDIPIIGSILEVERSSAHDVPRSIIILELTFNALFLSIVRIIPRFFIERSKVTATERRILIYGAGSKGEYFLRYLRSTRPPLYLPVGFIDDDINLHHRQIHEVPILGGKQYLSQNIADMDIDEIVVTIRNISDKNLRDIARICAQKNWDLKILPEISAVLQGKVDAIDWNT
jgi:FlaA1/EpsC-like NDP-sugar epimerase